MTVATETAYAERAWTGVETSFAAGFSALAAADCVVKYKDAADLVSTLTAGVHYSAALGAGDALTLTPLSMPAAPGTVLIYRQTPATQETEFNNLEEFDPDVHQRIADAGAMRDAEIRRDLALQVGPFEVAAGVVDFGDYRVAGAQAVENGEFTTLGQVLEVTGIDALQAYVDAAAVQAAAAAAAQTGAETAESGSQDARDLAQQWASNPHGVAVAGGLFSALSYATDAENSALAAATSALALANPDYGFVADAPTETRDYGSVV